MEQGPKHDRSWLVETGWEWMMGVLLAVPLVALYVHVDRNPSWWAVFGLRLSYSLISAAPVVSGGLLWAYDSDQGNEPNDHIVCLQAIGLTALLAWLTAILPVLFTPPGESPLPSMVDGAMRLSWLVVCAAVTLALLRAHPLPEAWRRRTREAFALLVLLAGLWPCLEGLARLFAAVVILCGVGLTAPVVWWWQRQQTSTKP
jgi:hypothetical protein